MNDDTDTRAANLAHFRAEVEAVRAARKPEWRACGNCLNAHAQGDNVALCARIGRWVLRSDEAECPLFELRDSADPDLYRLLVKSASKTADAQCGRCIDRSRCASCAWKTVQRLLAGAMSV